jgi:hypothetical protein
MWLVFIYSDCKNRVTDTSLSLVHVISELVMLDGQTFSREGVNGAEFIIYICIVFNMENITFQVG